MTSISDCRIYVPNRYLLGSYTIRTMQAGTVMDIDNLYGKDLAYVVIDVQKKFRITTEDAKNTGAARIETMNNIARMFREHNKPVIFVKYIGGCECHPYEGTDGDEFFDGIETDPTDIIVEKHFMNSFRESDLEKTVRGLGCNSVLLAEL